MQKQIKIGSRVRILERIEMTNITYEYGHEFTVYDSSGRGWDLVDDNGNIMDETMFVKMEYYDLMEERKEKIKKIRNNVVI